MDRNSKFCPICNNDIILLQTREMYVYRCPVCGELTRDVNKTKVAQKLEDFTTHVHYFCSLLSLYWSEWDQLKQLLTIAKDNLQNHRRYDQTYYRKLINSEHITIKKKAKLVVLSWISVVRKISYFFKSYREISLLEKRHAKNARLINKYKKVFTENQLIHIYHNLHNTIKE